MSNFPLNFVASADANWTFMDIEMATHTMACPVLEVESCLPKILTSENVHIPSCNTRLCWPNYAFKA
jgi:hypothetical protein